MINIYVFNFQGKIGGAASPTLETCLGKHYTALSKQKMLKTFHVPILLDRSLMFQENSLNLLKDSKRNDMNAF